jgi:hypothetical protein
MSLKTFAPDFDFATARALLQDFTEPRNGKPRVTGGRKATGLTELAGLPKGSTRVYENSY